MKKMVSKSSKPKPAPPEVKKETVVQKPKVDTPLLPFRRVEPIKSSSSSKDSSVSGGRPLTGLAGLAANLTGKADPSRVGKSETPKTPLSGTFPGLISLSNAASQVSAAPSSSTSGSVKSSSKQSSGSSRESKSLGSSSMMSADKRLQMMKKKAAAKQHDKRHK
jgi:integrator complex subunit 12